MFEVAVLVVAVVGIGLIRPRWSSLLAALLPTTLAFLWFLFSEDRPTGMEDLAWYVGMSLTIGAGFAACGAVGVIAGRALTRRRELPH